MITLSSIAKIKQTGGTDPPPAPPSPTTRTITGITFDAGSIRTAAIGSDNWPLTWADDGHQYTSYGDGYGFQDTGEDPSLGFARIEGSSHTTFSGYDIWETQTQSDPNGGKVISMNCINGNLYALRSRNSNNNAWRWHEMWKSTDKGETWPGTVFPRILDYGDDSFPSAGEAALPIMIQYGQNNAGNDGYMYFYTIRIDDAAWEVQKPGEMYLSRAPLANDEFCYESNWEWLTALDGGYNPTWGSYANRIAVLSDSDGFMRSSCLYHPYLDRYIMVTNHTARNLGNIAMWEAPDPWGPWSNFLHETSHPIFSSFAFGSFSPKWLDDEGNMEFAWFRPDKWNSINCQLEYLPIADIWEWDFETTGGPRDDYFGRWSGYRPSHTSVPADLTIEYDPAEAPSGSRYVQSLNWGFTDPSDIPTPEWIYHHDQYEGDQPQVYCRFRFKVVSGRWPFLNDSNPKIFRCFDQGHDSFGHLTVRNDGEWRWAFSPSGGAETSQGQTLFNNTWTWIECFLELNPGSNPRFRLWVEGSLELDMTSTSTTGSSQRIRQTRMMWAGGQPTVPDDYLDFDLYFRWDQTSLATYRLGYPG